MAMGADFLIKALLGAIGLDPVEAQKSLINLQNWVVTSIKSFDSRLRAAESVNADNARKLDLILSKLGVNENGPEQLAGTEQRPIDGWTTDAGIERVTND
jgi:hypothetical protein